MKYFLLVPITIALFSCASGKKSLREHQGSYLESVKLNFEAGEEELANGDYDKAITYFQFVRSKYPFSQYAALSDLRIADAKFAQKKWLDAASAYEVFIRLHPRHEEVEFASYRLGISYFHAVPSDFFLLPPSTSRDQTFTKEALAAIDRFILTYPLSKFIEDAKAKQVLLFSYLALHHQHVADYYERRGRYLAAIERHLLVEDLYPESAESLSSLFQAAEMYRVRIKDSDKAIELYQRIVDKQVDSPYTKKAEAALEKLMEERSEE